MNRLLAIGFEPAGHWLHEGDDVMAPFSSYGNTTDGITKPDLVAPGTNIISTLASPQAVLAQAHPDHLVGDSYFRLSGTSMVTSETW